MWSQQHNLCGPNNMVDCSVINRKGSHSLKYAMWWFQTFKELYKGTLGNLRGEMKEKSENSIWSSYMQWSPIKHTVFILKTDNWINSKKIRIMIIQTLKPKEKTNMHKTKRTNRPKQLILGSRFSNESPPKIRF